MATPEWPVPYYQRAFRAPAAAGKIYSDWRLEKNDMDLTYFKVPLHNVHAVLAKEQMKSAGKGHIVEAIENHFNLNCKF